MKRWMLAVLAMLALLAASASAPASAQTGGNPPPGPQGNCPSGGYPPCNPSSDVRNFGSFREGESFNKEDCGFDAGSTVTLTFNGLEAGSRQVESDGCARMTVTIGAQRRVTFNGRQFTADCGRNSIVVMGTGAGAARTVTNNFELNCAGGAGAAGAVRGPLPRTGAEFAGVTAGGIALLGIGAALVMATRRRRVQSS
jgi:LPXTG-motif cell wall-anchored protein